MTQKKMTQAELDVLLDKHTTWSNNHCGGGGARLSLYQQNISGLDFTGHDLRNATFCSCNMRSVDFSGANLTGCTLKGDLTRANLAGTILTDANLCQAEIKDAILPNYQIIPEVGQFHAWKQVRGFGKNSGSTYVLELLISGERTSSLVGRKCRCSKAKVLRAFASTGKPTKVKKFCSDHDSNFIYEVGKWVSEPKYNGDIRVECTRGIHFFISKREAFEYGL